MQDSVLGKLVHSTQGDEKWIQVPGASGGGSRHDFVDLLISSDINCPLQPICTWHICNATALEHHLSIYFAVCGTAFSVLQHLVRCSFCSANACEDPTLSSVMPGQGTCGSRSREIEGPLLDQQAYSSHLRLYK